MGASAAEPALITATAGPGPRPSAASSAGPPAEPWPVAGAGRFLQRDFDPAVPNVARVYDYLLGGKDNFAADRQAAARLLAAVPAAAAAARDNRAFLCRAVRFLTEEAGIRQFLDIGAGLPAAGAIHQIARGVVPPARVVYADYDPVVYATPRP